MPPVQVILSIIGIVVILFGCYYVTYYVGMKASGQTRTGLKNRNIKMLDRYAISRDKQFCIVEVADKVYVIGLTNHTMTLLDTFDAAAFAELTENDDDESTPWNMTPVGQYGNKLTRKLVAYVAEKTGKTGQKSKKSEETENSNENESTEESENKKETGASEKPEKSSFSDSMKEAKAKSSKKQPPKRKPKAKAESPDNQPKDPEEGV